MWPAFYSTVFKVKCLFWKKKFNFVYSSVMDSVFSELEVEAEVELLSQKTKESSAIHTRQQTEVWSLVKGCVTVLHLRTALSYTLHV